MNEMTSTSFKANFKVSGDKEAEVSIERQRQRSFGSHEPSLPMNVIQRT